MVSQQQFQSLKEMVQQQEYYQNENIRNIDEIYILLNKKFGNSIEDIVKQIDLHDHKFTLFTTKLKTEEIENKLNDTKLEIKNLESTLKREYLTESVTHSLVNSAAKYSKDTYFTYQLFNEHLEAAKKVSKKMEEKHKEIEESILLQKGILTEIQKELEPKISFKDFEFFSEIKIDTLKTRCSYDDLEALRQSVVPEIDGFREEVEIHKQLIQSFDEVLTEKASKFSVSEVLDKIHFLERMGKEYQELKDILAIKVNQTEKLAISVDNTIKELNKSISFEIK